MLLDRWYTITGRCIDEGRFHIWGKKGQVQSIGNVQALNYVDAFDRGQRIFPGGWEITKVQLQSHQHDGACGCWAKETTEDEDRC